MRILIIEDEKEISNFLKRNFENDCFAVDVARDGQEGLEKALAQKYDCLILDNIMPKMTGKEVCKEIRKNGSDTPILMLSVKSETDTKVEILNAGADDYMTKPFAYEELLARMRALLRRPKEMNGEIFEIDNLVIDTKKHQASRNNKKIYLTRKEYMLLSFLMRNKGAVLSRAMILENVWDSNADPFTNTIEAHIAALRRKIDKPGEKKLIHTLTGRGYKVDDRP